MRLLDDNTVFKTGKGNMNRFALISLCIFVLNSTLCWSQTSNNLQVIKSNDVELSIMLTTNICQAGSSIVCKTTLLNLSTNTIAIDPTSPNSQASQLSIFLVDDTGKKYRLTQYHSTYFGSRPIVQVKSDHNILETTEVTFDAALKPGEYTINATRLFTVNGAFFRAKANPVKVQIKE